MKLGQFTTTDSTRPRAGAITDAGIVDLADAGERAGVALPSETCEMFGVWNWREKAELAVEYATETGEAVRPRGEVTASAPITDPQKIIAIGLNYMDHADEGDMDVPESPLIFSKFPQAIVGPNDPVEWDPELTAEVDYEAELVAIIGDRARNVDVDEALEYVAGYTVGNDVSARDLQMSDEQWVRGKSLDTFAPLGPHVVTPDELDDVGSLDIWTEVNGERLQDANTEQLIFSIAELVSFCSEAFTLEPGDVIFTGTPDGVGYFREPRITLEDGDTMTVAVEGIGELTNECRHTP
ncbi:MAG: fumarylacetoacetate hydrolase family protein [Halobacteriota archaeon]|uniref:fumarylacetoacetate hydrolase family protein n=1 Tax=Natronomonas sp. TaxID=2184060 RepID=UPI003975F625